MAEAPNDLKKRGTPSIKIDLCESTRREDVGPSTRSISPSTRSISPSMKKRMLERANEEAVQWKQFRPPNQSNQRMTERQDAPSTTVTREAMVSQTPTPTTANKGALNTKISMRLKPRCHKCPAKALFMSQECGHHYCLMHSRPAIEAAKYQYHGIPLVGKKCDNKCPICGVTTRQVSLP